MMNQSRLFCLVYGIVLFTLLSTQGYSQTLSGSISDISGQPIPYSTVFIKEISFGTAANQQGQFEIQLIEGDYTFVFQSMGYQTISRAISVKQQNDPLKIVLPQMVFSLDEVEIKDDGEDPAYKIMRRVIRKAPYFARLVQSFEADVYIRGSLNIRKISSMVKWLASDDLKESEIKEGSTYLEESVNEISFRAPNITRQRVRSIQSTFPLGKESRASGAMGFISGNIYLPNAFGNAVSPLSPGAFKYYKFRYLGANSYDGITVDKIQIIPRGDGAQYVSGHLYIIEDLWCLHSLSITVNEQLGVTLKLDQNYGEIREGAWLPVNNQLSVDMELMGNEGSFDYHTSIRYNSIEVNPHDFTARKSETKTSKKNPPRKQKRSEARLDRLNKKTAELKQIENPTNAQAYRTAKAQNKKSELLIRDSLRYNHEYIETYKTVFDSNARVQDTEYWKKIRPIPLTVREMASLRTYDSAQINPSFKLADSSKKQHGKLWQIGDMLLFGGRYDADSLQYFKSAGVLHLMGISFNTVDGFVYKTNIKWIKRTAPRQVLSVGFEPGYAFARKQLLWQADISYKSEGKYHNHIGLSGGMQSVDFNNSGVMDQANTLYSLFLRDNLMRLYQKDFVTLDHSIEITPGLTLKSDFTFEYNRKLQNNSDFSFFYSNKKDYEPNIPDNPDYKMEDHRNMKLGIVISYKPMPYYYMKDGVRIPRPRMNKAPTFFLGLEKAIPYNDFYANYSLLKTGLHQEISPGLRSKISYYAEGGVFATSSKLYFNDYKHFASQPLALGTSGFFPVFQQSDFYRYSTDDWYLEGHFVYETPFLLLKRLPYVRNRLWTEKLLANYNYTPEHRHYYEVGYGIGNYFYDIGMFVGFENTGFRSFGAKITITVFGENEIVIGM